MGSGDRDVGEGGLGLLALLGGVVGRDPCLRGVVGSAVSASVTVAERETAFFVAGSLWLCPWPSSTRPFGWMWVPSGR